MKEYAFGIDLGGTTAKIGLFTTAGALLEKWEVPTDTSNAGEHILENLAAAIMGKMQEKAIPAEQVEGVGIGVPGPVLDSSVVPIVCANLGGWGQRNVAAQLSGLLDGLKVLVGNDANVAALGEIWMGAAKGCRSAVMVTLGTGVMELWAEMGNMLLPIIIAIIPVTVLVMVSAGRTTQAMTGRKKKEADHAE